MEQFIDMLDKFYVLWKPIKKALVDVGDGFDIDEEELIVVSEMVNALKQVKAAVDALCRRDANLLTADAILLFALFDVLEKHILERRTNLSGVLKYLHTGSFHIWTTAKLMTIHLLKS